MATQCVAAVPERELRFGVGSLVEHAIFRYLMQNDFVLSGTHVTKEMYETIRLVTVWLCFRNLARST